jgi:hypothetical protein
MAELNPWVGVGKTYVPDNPNMPVPPAHFLAPIHDYDAMLVILPSRQQPFTYVVARRRQLTAGLKFLKVDEQTPVDTVMCLENDCIPVCRMFQHRHAPPSEMIYTIARATAGGPISGGPGSEFSGPT